MLKYIFISLIFLPLKLFSWDEVNCSSLNKLSYDNNYLFSPSYCERNNSEGVLGEYMELYSSDGSYQYLYVTNWYLSKAGYRWDSDYSYQFIKRNYLQEQLINWNFGNSIKQIDSAETEIKFKRHKHVYRKFETDLGIGFKSVGQLREFVWEVIFFSEDDISLDENLIRTVLEPIKIRGAY